MKFIIKLIVSVMVLIMMTATSLAGFDFKNPCQYSGTQRDELSKVLKSQLIDEPIENINNIAGAKWEIKESQMPKILIAHDIFNREHGRYRNTEKISVTPLFQICKKDKNETTFLIYLEHKSNKITDADIEIFYADTDFWSRGEDLYWRRYGKNSDWRAAIQSIQKHVNTVKEWKEILTKAGYIEMPDCKSKKPDETLYWLPWFPPGSLAHKYGAMLVPDNHGEVILKSDGTVVLEKRACGKEIEKRVLRQYWERF